MKTNHSFSIRFLTGIIPLFAGAGLCAAPLTWFPGPPLWGARSAAATTSFSGGYNLLIGGDSSDVQELNGTNTFWTYFTPYNHNTLSPGAVAQGGMVIVYGGNDGVSSVNTVIGYSPSDGSQVLNPMSVPRSQLGYAPDHSGNAYAIGGLDDNGQPLSSVECYNQDSGNWGAVKALPTTLYDFPAVFDKTNYIYVFGGYTDTTSGVESASVFRYSISGNTWTTRASMPVAVAGSTAALGVDGKFYVVGGLSGGVAANVVQVYNAASNTWVISTPLPESLSASCMGVDTAGRLIVMGGADTNGNDVGDVWRSQLLGTPDSKPVLTQYPGTNGTYLAQYTSTISATGNPQPTFLVINGPAGMQVDNYSGVITWTPQADDIGTNSVTIRATNYAGYVDYTFPITVPNPPPATPANLYVISSNEYSVTLGWDPESPVAGPAVFSVYIPHPWHDAKGSGGGVNYQFVASTGSTYITISGLGANSNYVFDVNATAPGGVSDYAGIVATTTGPQPPASLWVTGITSTSITLAWGASPGPVPVVRYEVAGWIGGLFPTIEYGSNHTGMTALISGLAPGTYEEWSVRGYDADGNVSGFAPGVYAVNPVPHPASLSSLAPPSGGGFQFNVQASAVQTTYIQATTNISDPTSWVTIATNLPSSSNFNFTDTNSSQFSNRYYRVVVQ
jgi:hypothetical protein